MKIITYFFPLIIRLAAMLAGVSYILFIGSTVFAQAPLAREGAGNQITFFGIPIFSLTADQFFTFIAGSVILIPLTLLVLGVLFFLSTLFPFRRIPREAALVFGWNTMKNHKRFFIGLSAIMLILSTLSLPLLSLFDRFAPFPLRYFLQNTHFFTLPQTADQTLFSLFGFIFSTYIAAGVIRVTLDAHSGTPLRFSRLFLSPKKFFPFLVGNTLYTIALWAGLTLLVVPGILFASAFFFWQYRYLEGGKTLIGSFRDSLAMTRGARKEVFLFWYLSQIVAILGILAFGVGYFLSYPISVLSLAYVYRSLAKRLGVDGAPGSK